MKRSHTSPIEPKYLLLACSIAWIFFRGLLEIIPDSQSPLMALLMIFLFTAANALLIMVIVLVVIVIFQWIKQGVIQLIRNFKKK